MLSICSALAPRASSTGTRRRRIVHQKVQSKSPKYRRRRIVANADGDAKDEGPPPARENVDWREFRARLVASESSEQEEDGGTPGQMKKGLAPGGGPSWAHALTRPERGALLMAMDGEPGWWRHVVILILEHGPHGTMGLILNRTRSQTLRAHAPEKPYGHDTYWNRLGREIVGVGGPVGLEEPPTRSVIALTTKEQIGHTVEVVPGIYRVVDIDALARMNSKVPDAEVLTPDDLNLYVGYAGWTAGQLEGELANGFWTLAAASDVFIQDCMFKFSMDTVIGPDGKRVPMDPHGKNAWNSMRSSLGM